MHDSARDIATCGVRLDSIEIGSRRHTGECPPRSCVARGRVRLRQSAAATAAVWAYVRVGGDDRRPALLEGEPERDGSGGDGGEDLVSVRRTPETTRDGRDQ